MDSYFSVAGEAVLHTSTILTRVDVYVDYACRVRARSPEEAVDFVYEGLIDVTWKREDAAKTSRATRAARADARPAAR